MKSALLLAWGFSHFHCKGPRPEATTKGFSLNFQQPWHQWEPKGERAQGSARLPQLLGTISLSSLICKLRHPFPRLSLGALLPMETFLPNLPLLQ